LIAIIYFISCQSITLNLVYQLSFVGTDGGAISSNACTLQHTLGSQVQPQIAEPPQTITTTKGKCKTLQPKKTCKTLNIKALTNSRKALPQHYTKYTLFRQNDLLSSDRQLFSDLYCSKAASEALHHDMHPQLLRRTSPCHAYHKIVYLCDIADFSHKLLT